MLKTPIPAIEGTVRSARHLNRVAPVTESRRLIALPGFGLETLTQQEPLAAPVGSATRRSTATAASHGLARSEAIGCSSRVRDPIGWLGTHCEVFITSGRKPKAVGVMGGGGTVGDGVGVGVAASQMKEMPSCTSNHPSVAVQ